MQKQMTRPAQRPQPAPQRPSGGGGISPTAIATVLGLAVIVLLGYFMQFVWFPDGLLGEKKADRVLAVSEIASSRGVRINEVMSSNKRALSDISGASPDWVELYNYSNAAVDVTGWALEDKAGRTNYFVFPQTVLEPGEYIIVFATGAAGQAGELCAPFKLSSTGDTLMLFDDNGTVVQSMNLPAMQPDQSYSYMESGWSLTGDYTPGLANTREMHAELTSVIPLEGNTLFINEIMADNASTLRAADGQYYDWIELYNAGDADVDLTGYSLSDSLDKPQRFKMSGVTVPAGGYKVIFASGRGVSSGEELHANFRLGAEGETVVLYNANGRLLDAVDYDNLKTDKSLSRTQDGGYTTDRTPTPGAANGG